MRRGIMASLRGLATAQKHAPLAQSAERLHGKEKVVSSILTGSSSEWFSVRPGFGRSEGGDVAQLVRALDS